MRRATGLDRLWLLVPGFPVITVPALTLVVAPWCSRQHGASLIERITLVDAVELYLVEATAVVVFSYLLYRLTLYTVRTGDRVATEGVEAN